MTELRMIPVDDIVPNPDQPRVEFDPAEIASLATSIQEQGQIQAIAVEECQEGYRLIDGERRWRAVKSLGLALIRAEVRTYDEPPADKFSQAVVANLQRADLNPIEEARVFSKMQAHGITQATIARTVGKSISHVNFRLKMLDLEPEIQELLAARKLPMDPQAITDLFRLPENIRVPIVKKYAAKGMTGAGIKTSVSRIIGKLNRTTADMPLTGSRAPAAQMSGDKGEPRMLKILEKDGSIPQWRLVEEAAKETCDNCELNDMASAQMCKDCPAVELLKRLNKLAHTPTLQEKSAQ